MWRFVLTRNINRYRRLIEAGANGEKRQTLEALLEAAEHELRDLETASARATTAADARVADILQNAVDAAMRSQNAQFGNIQLYENGTRTLVIAAQRNFRKPFLDHFAAVSAGDGSACGKALAQEAPFLIEDVADETTFAPHLDIAREAGFRAVQSTPLMAPSGEPLGMISTHFANPRRFSTEDRPAMEGHARHLSAVLASCLSA